MKSHLKGFVQGTTHVTTGDTIKPGDHVRHKARCFYYNNGNCKHYARKCTGSSHCYYYNDGIKVNIIKEKTPNLHTHEKLLISWVQNELKNKINHRSLEGKFIIRLILKNHLLSNNDLEKAEKQIADFNQGRIRLEKEITDYNRNLKKKCILIGLLLITAPFCYAYYQNNVRDIKNETMALKNKIVDSDLQKKVEQYNIELKEYQKYSDLARIEKSSLNDKDSFFVRAKIEYKHKEYERFYEMLSKSIKEEKNIKAILFLVHYLRKESSYKNNEIIYWYLMLYASYLGHKESTAFIGKILLSQNPNSKMGRKFIEKAKT